MSDLRFLECQIQMPLMSLPVRSTIVTLPQAVLLISPGSQLTSEDLKTAGAVTDIIAPSLLHCGGMRQAHQVFPKARLWGPPGASTRKPEIPWTDTLSETHWPFQKELKLLELHGAPRFQEMIFFHQKSKSLIVTDLFFNVEAPQGFGSWLIMSAFGTYKRFAMSRLFASAIQDKEAFTASLENILQEDFETIIMAHGSPLKAGPQEALQALRRRGFRFK